MCCSHAMHKRRKHKREGRYQGLRVTALSTSESTQDFHKYWMQQNGLTPVLRFHLAASINPATGMRHAGKVTSRGAQSYVTVSL